LEANPIYVLIQQKQYDQAKLKAQSIAAPTKDDLRASLLLYRDLADVANAEAVFRRMRMSGYKPASFEYP
jgi:hypothetical protein